MLSTREAFKVGFLHRCAKEGLTEEEMLTRVKSARTKLASALDLLTTPYNAAASLGGAAAGHLGNAALAASVLAPLAVGGLGGYAAANALDADEVDAEAVRKRDLIAQLRQLTEQAKQNAALAQRRRNQARPYSRI